MNNIDFIKEYLEKGLRIFPVNPSTKTPIKSEIREALIDSWKPQDKSLLIDWWTNYPDSNIGVVTGGYFYTFNFRGTTIFDCDVKGNKDGINKFLNLCTQLNFNPYKYALWITDTPSGGRHYAFKFMTEILHQKQSPTKGKLHGVDILNGSKETYPNFVLMPTSLIDGKPYSFLKYPTWNVPNVPSEIGSEIQAVIPVVKPNKYQDNSDYVTQHTKGRKVVRKIKNYSSVPPPEVVAHYIHKDKKKHFYIGSLDKNRDAYEPFDLDDKLEAVAQGIQHKEDREWIMKYLEWSNGLAKHSKWARGFKKYLHSKMNKRLLLKYETNKDYYNNLYYEAHGEYPLDDTASIQKVEDAMGIKRWIYRKPQNNIKPRTSDKERG